MAENLDVFKFEINDEEMPRIAELHNTGASIAFDNRDVQMVSRIGIFANRWPDLQRRRPVRGSSCQSRKQADRAVASGRQVDEPQRAVAGI
jgi:hypothetical protein